MATIVVLGDGIGGVSQAFELKPLLRPNDRLVVINDQPRFEFTPSNPWVAVRTRTEDQTTIELAPLYAQHEIEFHEDAATLVNPESNQIELVSGKTIDYDYLVIATGPALAFDEVTGLGPSGHTSSICKTSHAVDRSQEFDDLLENPGPVIVGAAQSNMECRLFGGLRRHRRRLCRFSPNSVQKYKLGIQRQVGPFQRSRFQEVPPTESAKRPQRAVL